MEDHPPTPRVQLEKPSQIWVLNRSHVPLPYALTRPSWAQRKDGDHESTGLHSSRATSIPDSTWPPIFYGGACEDVARKERARLPAEGRQR